MFLCFIKVLRKYNKLFFLKMYLLKNINFQKTATNVFIRGYIIKIKNSNKSQNN